MILETVEGSTHKLPAISCIDRFIASLCHTILHLESSLYALFRDASKLERALSQRQSPWSQNWVQCWSSMHDYDIKSRGKNIGGALASPGPPGSYAYVLAIYPITTCSSIWVYWTTNNSLNADGIFPCRNFYRSCQDTKNGSASSPALTSLILCSI